MAECRPLSLFRLITVVEEDLDSMLTDAGAGADDGVGCLKDHTQQGMNLDSRIEDQLHQLMKAGRRCKST
jgi:hypothetical protein